MAEPLDTPGAVAERVKTAPVTLDQQFVPLSITLFLITFSAGCYATFLGSFLGRKGINRELAGLIGGAGSAALIAGNLFWGFISDRSGRRKPFVITGMAASAICFLGWLWCERWQEYVFLSAITQFWNVACTTLLFVMAIDLLPVGARSQRFGQFRLWGSAGLLTASWGVGWLIRQQPDRVFLFSGCAVALGILPFLAGTKEVVRPKETRFHVAHVLRNPRALLFLFTTFLHGAWEPGAFLFLSYSLAERGVSEGAIGMVLGVNGVVGLFALPLAGRLADRWGRLPMLVIMYFLSALRMVLYSIVTSPWALIPVQVLQFGSFGIAEAVGSVYIADQADERDRATAVTCFYTAHSIGALLASLAGGWVSARYGFARMYQAFAVAMLLAAVAFWVSKQREQSCA